MKMLIGAERMPSVAFNWQLTPDGNALGAGLGEGDGGAIQSVTGTPPDE